MARVTVAAVLAGVLSVAPGAHAVSNGRIVFERFTGSFPLLATVAADGSDVRDIPNTSRLEAPAWSPSRLRIAAAFSDGGGIAVLGAHGARRRTFARSFVTAIEPTWSPDGRRIAFVGERSPGDASQLWELDVRSGKLRRLTTTPGAKYRPDWSPDGRRIAFATGDEQDANDLVLLDVAGKHKGRSVRLRLPGHDDAPAWSPDGRRLAFVSDSGASTYDVYVMRADGSRIARVTRSTPEEQLRLQRVRWSPDGTSLVFSRQVGVEHELVVLSASGGGQRVLFAQRGVPVQNPDW